MNVPRMIAVAAHQRAAPAPPLPSPTAGPDATSGPMSGPPMVPGPMGPSMSMGSEVTGRAPAVFRPHRLSRAGRGYA